MFIITLQLVNRVLWDLNQVPEFENNSIVVKLNGLLHTDDKLALKAITTQVLYIKNKYILSVFL